MDAFLGKKLSGDSSAGISFVPYRNWDRVAEPGDAAGFGTLTIDASKANQIFNTSTNQPSAIRMLTLIRAY